MQPGSPTRLEAGQANGAEATSPTGSVNAGAPGQAGGILGTTAGNLVGAGTLVAGPQMLPMTTGYVLKEDMEVLWIRETTECMAKVAQETIA